MNEIKGSAIRKLAFSPSFGRQRQPDVEDILVQGGNEFEDVAVEHRLGDTAD
jgi:hypothetical protein